MKILDDYIDYVQYVRRYSTRTVAIYTQILQRFIAYHQVESDRELLDVLTPAQIRNYQVYLLDECKMQARTVLQHLSALSAFSRYLISREMLSANPISAVKRPKTKKRLPVFYRDEALERYFDDTAWWASREALEQMSLAPTGTDEPDSAQLYHQRLSRLILSLLYATGMRRAEMIALNRSSFDRSRQTMTVKGKGDKMRTIPLVFSLFEEIVLYLNAVDSFIDCEKDADSPLLVTIKGKRLYPTFVDRVVKTELAGVKGISGRLSPHVLRHSLATQLLGEGGDLNSIKEMLGHSSLAATQVYTHNSVAQLSKIYQTAHPRAKKRR